MHMKYPNDEIKQPMPNLTSPDSSQKKTRAETEGTSENEVVFGLLFHDAQLCI
jgi:hypothetical protein